RRRHLALLWVESVENVIGGRGAARLARWVGHRLRSSQTGVTGGPVPGIEVVMTGTTITYHK
ncbi:MAG: hypothetical protein ABIP19_12225, partial [Dermatophilaceae bacterium]